jgi:hypothetical protein
MYMEEIAKSNGVVGQDANPARRGGRIGILTTTILEVFFASVPLLQ